MSSALILLATIIGFFYLYVKKKHSYWRKHGIPHTEPMFFMGHMWESFTQKKNFGEVCTDIYRAFPDYKYTGIYKFLSPAILVRDPELIRHVMIKDFNHFKTNDAEIHVDDIFAKHPFVLKGNEWKNVRRILTPYFTNATMRTLFPFIQDVSKKLVKYVNEEIIEEKENCVDSYDLCIKFTTESVASCVFGISAEAFHKNDSNFVKTAKSVGELSLINGIKFFLLQRVPFLSRILKFSIINEKCKNYFLDIISQTLNYRRINNIKRYDFLDVMNNIKETNLNFTDLDILSHSIGFFADGVVTSGSTLSYVLFEIAANQKVQEKLRYEIHESHRKHKLDYHTLNQIHYLEAVINESLRRNSPAIVASKLCTKDYHFPPPKGANHDKQLKIRKGTTILIPFAGLQEDEKYFSEPLKFVPDRFLNKESGTKCTFMPFGEGPRMCLGMKFGLIQVKVALVALVENFEIRLSAKTEVPLKIHPCGLVRTPLNGIWLEFFKIRK